MSLAAFIYLTLVTIVYLKLTLALQQLVLIKLDLRFTMSTCIHMITRAIIY
jgi:hypothetical protein